MRNRASDLLYSWNVPIQGLGRIVIEEDTRDALQSVSVLRPSPTVRAELLHLSDRIGIDLAFIGFPAASKSEADLCRTLIDHISSQRLRIRPVVMSRAIESDLQQIIDIQQEASTTIIADIYISISQLRLAIEGWDLSGVLKRLHDVCLIAIREGLDFRIAFEDSTRASPAHVMKAVNAALMLNPACIVLNDTTGDCLPSGAAQHTQFVNDIIDRCGASVPIAWHGHNDKGLALANALASIQGGASIVSGTILGIGERTGNVPLEQLMFLIAEVAGKRFDLFLLEDLCRRFAEGVAVQIPNSMPLVGADVFSTATGTHVAAIAKAAQFGTDFADLVYSGVAASSLGRKQTLLIGPNSGRASVRVALQTAGLPCTDSDVETVLRQCKTRRDCIRTVDDLRHALLKDD